jgi:predicted ATP-dependent protease
LAVTGSIDQHGHVQAVGAINEKIEGFFDLCRQQSLTGRQGVLIPADNVQHLMLREDVVSAVAQGRFHVYAVRTVDEAITTLSSVLAGERQADGRFPDGTINSRVENRLVRLAERRREFIHERGERRDFDPTAPARH